MDGKEIKRKMVEQIDQEFGLKGWKDYINEHFGEAIEVDRNGGQMFDLDNIVHLEEILGFKVSYGLYHYINSRIDNETIFDLTDKNYDWLMDACWAYAENLPF